MPAVPWGRGFGVSNWGGMYRPTAPEADIYGSMMGATANIYGQNQETGRNWLDNWVRSQANNQNYDIAWNRGNLDRLLGEHSLDLQGELGRGKLAVDRYGIDKGLEGSKYGWDAQGRIAETQIKPAMLAQENQMARFGSVFPWIQSQFGGAGGNAPPEIDDAPELTVQDTVYSPELIQQNLNNIAGQGARWTGGQQRNIARNPFQSSGAKGALGLQAAALSRANVGNQQLQFGNQAATANAQQGIAANQLRQGRWGNMQGLKQQRFVNQTGRMSPLLGLLGQFA